MALTQISTAGVKDDAVTAGKIPANAVGASELADNAVDTAAIASDAVTGAKIADDAINSEHYTDGSIDTAHIADSQITTAKIADNAITGGKMADNAINTSEIVDSAVTTAKIANDAINRDKIADDVIASEHFIAGEVDANALASNAVTTAKIADDAITTAKIANDTVTVGKIQNFGQNQIAGRVANGTGDLQGLSASDVRTMINVADGATNSPTTTINNNADNRVITGSGTANTLEGEDKFTWNGNNLHIERTVTAYEQPLVNIYNAGAYGWGGAIRFSANWANTEEHQATIKTYGGNSSTAASLAFNVGAANSEKLRIQNGGGISFNGDTAAANALDDYEEGTFNATCGNGVTLHASQNECMYTKIGRQVTVRGQVRINDDSSDADFQINNLPFSNGGGNEGASVSVGACRLWDYSLPGDTINVICQVDSTTNNLDFWRNRDNAGAERLDADDNAYVAFTCTYFTS